MSKFIGRQFNVGIGRETTRGTPRVSAYWIPTTDISIDEKVSQVKYDNVYGVIENQSDADVVKTYAEGTISGVVDDTVLGLLLNATFGTSVSTGPTDSAYTHTYNVLQTAQHSSLTINVSEPNATTSLSKQFPLAMVDSLELGFEVGAYPTYSMAFVSNVTTATTTSVAYTTPFNFKPQQGVVRIADTYSNLATGTTYTVRKVSLNISKNLEDDHNIGSLAVTDRLNKQFAVTGSMELVYNDREFIDTFMLTNLTRAMQIKFTNTDRTIGVSTNPSITIRLAKVKFQEVAKNVSKDDITMQTVNFEAFYSYTDSKMMDTVLVNSVASY
jgi:hypothetical protein